MTPPTLASSGFLAPPLSVSATKISAVSGMDLLFWVFVPEVMNGDDICWQSQYRQAMFGIEVLGIYDGLISWVSRCVCSFGDPQEEKANTCR